jgi:hypothetical protein
MRKLAMAGIVTAAMAFAPSTAADVPGIVRFAGTEHAYEEGHDIQPGGHGRETCNDRSTCPRIADGRTWHRRHYRFMLTPVASDTALGIITAATDLKQPIGGRRPRLPVLPQQPQ